MYHNLLVKMIKQFEVTFYSALFQQSTAGLIKIKCKKSSPSISTQYTKQAKYVKLPSRPEHSREI